MTVETATTTTTTMAEEEAPESAIVDYKVLPTDFYYENSAVGEPPSRTGELPRDVLALDSSFGFDSNLRNNLHYIGEPGSDDVALLFSTGNCVHLVKVSTGQVSYLFGHNTGGVGALAVHPNRTLFAVGEKGPNPNIIIYEYPSLRPYRILRLGTEAAYSDLDFSFTGNQLASVGSAPDYMLTVWDWKNERIILRTKAFAQEVYNVRFSPYDEGKLTTSGMGHIRFWKMATTFTGLKLQGDIGKFGKFDLSDVSAFAELEDGKVLSGSEIGQLLLWEGNFIKIEVGRPNGGLAHDGEIYFVTINPKTGQCVTAGDDGAVRFWSYEPIDTAEASDENPRLELEPTKEVNMPEGVKVRGVLRGLDHWVLLGANGCLWRVDDTLSDGRRAKTLMRFHSGSINGVVASPTDHFAATAGEDGTVRCWDYVDRMCLYESKFPTAATCIDWAPTTLDSEARTVAIGFASGVVRILYRAQREWKILSVMKPHDGQINNVKYSKDGQTIATCGNDGRVFFLTPTKATGESNDTFTYNPIGFYQFEQSKGNATNLTFRDDNKCILICLVRTGEVLEIGLPGSNEENGELNTHESFDVTATCTTRSHLFTAKPSMDAPVIVIPVEGEEEKKEGDDLENPFEMAKVEKLSIVNAIYLPGHVDKFLVTLASSTLNYVNDAPATQIHSCEFGKEYAEDELYGHNRTCGGTTYEPKGTTSVLSFSTSKKVLLSGGGDGSTMIRCVVDQEGGDPIGSGTNLNLSALSPFFVNVSMHDAENPENSVTGAVLSFDDKYLLTTGSRGGFFSFRVRYDELEKSAQSAADGRAKELAAKAAKAAMVSTATVTAELDQSMDEIFGTVSSSVPGDFHDDDKESKISEAKDMDDPSKAYSIEDAKLKTEEDNKRKAANIKKDKTREAILNLRKRYMVLFKENQASPDAIKLSLEEVALDADVVKRLISAGDAKCEEVEKILRWESEKRQLAVEKLQKRFLSNVAVEGIDLKTFQTNNVVRSFRTTSLPDSLQESLRAVHALIDAEDDARRRAGKLAALNKENKNGDLKNGLGGKKKAKFNSPDKKGKGEEEVMDERTQEARKMLRGVRRIELDTMMSKKPDLGEEDPTDVAAIEDTRTNLGDKKLKNALDYVVPEDQRVNAEKKKRQMVLLEESIHSIKMGYNQRFLALRDLKRRIIGNIESDNVRVREIDLELINIETNAGNDDVVDDIRTKPDLWEPKIDPKEFPEERFQVTSNELAEELGETVSSDTTASKSSPTINNLNTNAGGDEIDQIPQLRAASSLFNQNSNNENEGTASNAEQGEEDSLMEVALRDERRITLLHERKVLLDKTNQTVTAFDEAMYDLRREKIKLDADLKTAEMRGLTFLSELEMLKEFEKKETMLSTKLEKNKIEKGSVSTEIGECKTKLEAKRQEIEVWQEKDKVIESEFSSLVPESNVLWPQLFKIFKRKIKRTKKSNNDGDGSGDDSDYESSEEESSDDEGDSDDDDEDDSCPAGCDQALYDKVLELREKRLDQEDILADFQKNIDDLKKSFDRLNAREKTITKEFIATEKDIELFQTEKQRKLNTLDVYITVQLSQILHLVPSVEYFANEKNGKKSQPSSPSRSPMRRMMSDTASMMSSTMGMETEVPPEYVLHPDMSAGLVMQRPNIDSLKHRIVGIQEETLIQDSKFKNLHKEKKKLYREKKSRKKLITAQEEKCNDLQMLKFGQTIDLESLDKMGSRKALDEVNQKKKRLERRQEIEIVKAKKSIRSANENLIETTQENTVQLERIAQLTHQQQSLEKELNSGGSGGSGDQGGIMRRDVEERNRLVQLVKLQAKEVDALKAEINMLRRKGGHVYTPAVSTSPNRGQSGLHGVSAGSLGMESPEMEGGLPSR